jgi:hypothetical protein
MLKQLSQRPHFWLGLLLSGGLAFAFFSTLFLLNIYTDIQGHIEQLQAMLRGELVRGNFLYYLSIWLVALGQSRSLYLGMASILVLSLAVGARYVISLEQLKGKGSVALTLTLVFAFSLPGPEHYYLGQIPPNIWHNSTTIFLMPFALLLFRQSESYLQEGTPKRLSWLVVLNVLIKPSFFFCLGVILPLLGVKKWGIRKAFADLWLPIGLGWLLVAAQYLFTYWLDPLLAPADALDQVSGGGIQWAPGLVWQANTSSIPLSLLASLLFPLAYLLIWRKDLQNMRSLGFVFSLLGMGILLFYLLAETGDRTYHGNFAWQNIVIMYLLFWVLVRDLSERMQQKTGWKANISLLFLGLHLLSGLSYLCKIILTGSYF